MNPVLVVVETRHGHCAKIAERVVDRIRAEGLEVYLEQSPGAHPIAVSRFGAAVVIAAVYDRRYPRSIEELVRSHAYALSSCPSAFISVSLGAAAKRKSAKAGIARLTRSFLERTGWRRCHVVMTGGCIAYPLYAPWLRRTMRMAAWLMGLPTDTTKSHDLTTWSAIDDAADEVLADLATLRLQTPMRVA
ncbi:MAG: hypothetical protein KIT84_16330 [Labilithrix sp.]|nr:hypothetical protein [Labilithrix sp.]MCW5812597.1 hypothetical protein [Labilithrix sp.]